MFTNPTKQFCRYSVRCFSQDLQLQVKDPAFLLTHIASHYRHLSKIIAEFVDNSLDDAEQLSEPISETKRRYTRPVNIDIRLTLPKDEGFPKIDIVDNCFGMSTEDLSGLVNNIGQSKKRKDPTTNGYFGFGINSFRACSEILIVQTKHESGQHIIRINKDDTTIASPAPFSGNKNSRILDFETGTQVTLYGVYRPFTSQMRYSDKLRTMLSQHFFHHLVNRENLQISITDWEAGVEHKQILQAIPPPIKDNHRLDITEISLCRFSESALKINVGVLPHDFYSYPEVAVVSQGREVQKLNNLDSFLAAKKDWKLKNPARDNIWDKPQIKGYIDVGGDVEKVISRDEFKETMQLGKVYEQILKFGSTKKNLDFVNDIIAEANDSKIGMLSSYMANIVDKRHLFDKARERMDGKEVEEFARKQVDKSLNQEINQFKKEAAQKDKALDVQADPRPVRVTPPVGKQYLKQYKGSYPIEFEHAGPTGLRARMENTTTIINEDHPDAQSELFQGSADLKINSKTFRYLARQVSNMFLIRELESVDQGNIAMYINEVQNLEIEIQRSFEKYHQVGMFDQEGLEQNEAVVN